MNWDLLKFKVHDLIVDMETCTHAPNKVPLRYGDVSRPAARGNPMPSDKPAIIFMTGQNVFQRNYLLSISNVSIYLTAPKEVVCARRYKRHQGSKKKSKSKKVSSEVFSQGYEVDWEASEATRQEQINRVVNGRGRIIDAEIGPDHIFAQVTELIDDCLRKQSDVDPLAYTEEMREVFPTRHVDVVDSRSLQPAPSSSHMSASSTFIPDPLQPLVHAVRSVESSNRRNRVQGRGEVGKASALPTVTEQPSDEEAAFEEANADRQEELEAMMSARRARLTETVERVQRELREHTQPSAAEQHNVAAEEATTGLDKALGMGELDDQAEDELSERNARLRAASWAVLEVRYKRDTASTPGEYARYWTRVFKSRVRARMERLRRRALIMQERAAAIAYALEHDLPHPAVSDIDSSTRYDPSGADRPSKSFRPAHPLNIVYDEVTGKRRLAYRRKGPKDPDAKAHLEQKKAAKRAAKGLPPVPSWGGWRKECRNDEHPRWEDRQPSLMQTKGRGKPGKGRGKGKVESEGKSKSWKCKQVREGNVAMWGNEQKQYPLGRPGFTDMYWEGDEQMDEQFLVRVYWPTKKETVEVKVTGSMRVRSLKRTAKKQLGERFEVMEKTSAARLFLWKDGEQIIDENAALQDVGVNALDELELKWKRSRAGAKQRPSKKRNIQGYKLARKFNVSKADILRVLRNIPTPPPPLQHHREGDLIPLTALHYQFLERASEALDQATLQHELPSSSMDLVGQSAITDGTVEETTTSSDTDEDELASKTTRLHPSMDSQGNAASVSMVSSSTVPAASSSSRATLEAQIRFVPSSMVSDASSSSRETAIPTSMGSVQMQITEAELDQMYGKGVALTKALGWSHGQTLGALTSEAALRTPLQTPSPLSQMVPRGSVEAYMRKNDKLDIANKPLTKHDVRPPSCEKDGCSKKQWPAYKTKARKRKDGTWRPSRWCCVDCAQSIPVCVVCKKKNYMERIQSSTKRRGELALRNMLGRGQRFLSSQLCKLVSLSGSALSNSVGALRECWAENQGIPPIRMEV